MPGPAAVAYFSMEIALDPAMPTYSGGLGVLAGDTVRSFADLGVSAIGVTLVHRRGYFRQSLADDGTQREAPVEWPVEASTEALEPRVSVDLEGRTVRIRAWRYRVRGANGAEVPVYLLDTDLPENSVKDRRLTDTLYGGDERHRLCQETVLGVGGLRMLRALGHRSIRRFHLNEGHAALAVMELMEEVAGPDPSDQELAAKLAEVRRQCVFTTHTPVPAGHDRFPRALVDQVLGYRRRRLLRAFDGRPVVNMTDVALRASHFVNGVAMRHGEVSRGMFPDYPIRSITNGIHPATWASPPFQALFDRHVPEWRRDAFSLRYAVGIPAEEIWQAHRAAKRTLIERVAREGGQGFDPEAFTLGFARRATAYKRAALLFREPERLAAIAKEHGPLQLVFAGKAHPRDQEGKELIRAVLDARGDLGPGISLVYLPDYDWELGRVLVAGCDAWLNTPVPGLEASGTSGMKAALNGVPSLSVLDGWWIEGCMEGVTGWAVGDDDDTRRLSPAELDLLHADCLYEKLETEVLPGFYRRPERFRAIMRSAIALNASFFNTHRMVLQYLYEAYGDPGRGRLRAEG